jgi:hypothetical protein
MSNKQPSKRKFNFTSPDKELGLRLNAPEPKFMVDDKGHLKNRREIPHEDLQRTASIARARTCGNVGFTFSKYISLNTDTR